MSGWTKVLERRDTTDIDGAVWNSVGGFDGRGAYGFNRTAGIPC